MHEDGNVQTIPFCMPYGVAAPWWRRWVAGVKNKWQKKAHAFEDTGVTKKYQDEAGVSRVCGA